MRTIDSFRWAKSKTGLKQVNSRKKAPPTSSQLHRNETQVYPLSGHQHSNIM